MNCAILGAGNIGVDLYLKLKKKKINNVSIFNLNPNSSGAKYCRRRGFSYYSNGIIGVLKNLNDFDIIFDATNSKSNLKHSKILKSKKKNIS
jgi:acetaldehyde dehydrogenase (acetylating)